MNSNNSLSEDLQTQLRQFKLIGNQFEGDSRSFKELQKLSTHLKEEINVIKQNERKYIDQVNDMRQICQNQENIIANLHTFKEKNEILIQENAKSLQETVILKQKIEETETAKQKFIENQIALHKEEIAKIERYAEAQAQEIQNEMEVAQASADLRYNDLQIETKNIIMGFEEKLRNASELERNLKAQINMLNNNMSSNIAVYQKKVFEMEQKVRNLESERSQYMASKGNFVSAQTLLKTSGINQIKNKISDTRNENFGITSNSNNYSENNNQPKYEKKFKFRKFNSENESLHFNSFEMKKLERQSQIDNAGVKENVNSQNFSNAYNQFKKPVNLESNSRRHLSLDYQEKIQNQIQNISNDLTLPESKISEPNKNSELLYPKTNPVKKPENFNSNSQRNLSQDNREKIQTQSFSNDFTSSESEISAPKNSEFSYPKTNPIKKPENLNLNSQRNLSQDYREKIQKQMQSFSNDSTLSESEISVTNKNPDFSYPKTNSFKKPEKLDSNSQINLREDYREKLQKQIMNKSFSDDSHLSHSETSEINKNPEFSDSRKNPPKSKFPLLKKRKLFDPNNFDYLDKIINN